MNKPIIVIDGLLDRRARELREGDSKPKGPPIFYVAREAMTSTRDVEFVIISEPDEFNVVRVRHEGQEKVVYLQGVLLWKLRKWAYMPRPLKNAEISVRRRHGRLEVDISAGISTEEPKE